MVKLARKVVSFIILAYLVQISISKMASSDLISFVPHNPHPYPHPPTNPLEISAHIFVRDLEAIFFLLSQRIQINHKKLKPESQVTELRFVTQYMYMILRKRT